MTILVQLQWFPSSEDTRLTHHEALCKFRKKTFVNHCLYIFPLSWFCASPSWSALRVSKPKITATMVRVDASLLSALILITFSTLLERRLEKSTPSSVSKQTKSTKSLASKMPSRISKTKRYSLRLMQSGVLNLFWTPSFKQSNILFCDIIIFWTICILQDCS